MSDLLIHRAGATLGLLRIELHRVIARASSCLVEMACRVAPQLRGRGRDGISSGCQAIMSFPRVQLMVFQVPCAKQDDIARMRARNGPSMHTISDLRPDRGVSGAHIVKRQGSAKEKA